MAKANLKNLDEGQLGMMWDMLQLRPKNSCVKADVQELKKWLDYIRQALIQKGGGQESNPSTQTGYVDFTDLGTYINLVVVSVLSLYVYGGLDALENILPENEGAKNGEKE